MGRERGYRLVEENKENELYEWFFIEFTQIRNPLFSYIFSLLPHRDDAEDVFQRTSLILWEKIDLFDQQSNFFSWACGVAFYEVKNFLRVTSRKRVQFRDDLMQQLADERIDMLKDNNSRIAALQDCMEKLKQKDRDLLTQAYNSSDSIRELAEKTGKAVQSLYNRLNWLRGQLADCIERQIRLQGGAS